MNNLELSQGEKQRIVSYFRDCLLHHGYASAQSLDWVDALSQHRRFQVLEKIGDLNGKTILDVGSGLGDFYKYLRKRGYNLKFTGIDLVPEFVAFSQSFHKGATFFVAELPEVTGQFDFVFASGSLSFNISNHRPYLLNSIKKMLELSKAGVGFNLLDSRRFTSDQDCAAYHPEEILSLAAPLAKKAALIQGYLPQDFTIFLYK